MKINNIGSALEVARLLKVVATAPEKVERLLKTVQFAKLNLFSQGIDVGNIKVLSALSDDPNWDNETEV